MSSFPLLNLPILAIENVLINLNTPEIIEFSLCSLKCKRIVKSIKYPYTGIHVNLTGCGHCLTINFKEHKCLEWRFQLKLLPRGGKEMWRTIGGTKIKVKLNRNNVLSSTRNPENQVKIVYDYLQEIFNLPVSLHHSYKENSSELHPHYFNVTECEDIWIGSADQIPHEHLRYVIEDVKTSKHLLLNMRKNPEFQCDPNTRLSIDELHVLGAQWVNRDIFLSLNCARITFEKANLARNDIEDFISQWYHSDSTRLEWLEMKPAVPVGLKKLQPKPWDADTRERYFRKWTGISNKLDCSQGMDIIRSDGLIATIVYESTKLYFVVWHNRFPELPEN